MKKSSFGFLFAATALASLAMVAAVHAQADDGANDNSNVNISVNVNAPDAPPQPLPPSPDSIGVQPPVQNDGEVKSPPARSGQGGKRIKIEHPQLIKFFSDIKQVGNSLFGVLKNEVNNLANGADTTGQTTAPAADDSSGSLDGANTMSQMEKILTPDMVKLYSSIKKIGGSLFGVRKDGGSAKARSGRTVTAEESACVIAAIKTKDQTLIDGKTAEAAAFTAAVAARTACQTAALGSIDGQAAAITLCNKSFVIAVGQSRDAFAKTQKTAWETYKTAQKACAVAPVTGATSAEIMVEDGSNALLPMPGAQQ